MYLSIECIKSFKGLSANALERKDCFMLNNHKGSFITPLYYLILENTLFLSKVISENDFEINAKIVGFYNLMHFFELFEYFLFCCMIKEYVFVGK
jgi:hypothetical protein